MKLRPLDMASRSAIRMRSRPLPSTAASPALIEREASVLDENADDAGEDALGHGPAEQRRRGRKVGAIALRHDAAMIDHDDGAHTGACERVIGKEAIQRGIGHDRGPRGHSGVGAGAGEVAGAVAACADARREFQIAVGHHRAAVGRPPQGQAIADEAEQSGAHDAPLAIDRHPHERSSATPGACTSMRSTSSGSRPARNTLEHTIFAE